ncbi:MAG TPA: prephenate dehydrogenase/arogenate dehydrogenase family protein [Gaiellales bacterium]
MRIAVIGLGLIGGSLALAATARGDEVVAADPDARAGEIGLERGAIARFAASTAEAMDGADMAFVCGPVAEVPALAREALDAAPAACTVSDVGSTKGRVVELLGGSPQFVGGHPVCGSEARGVANARPELFEGATWFLTPVAETDPAAHRRLHTFVSSLGARPVAIDPDAHDRLMALTSHLPHALANVLVNQAGAGRVDGHDPLAAVGGSFRDMTRVAGANPRVWVDIFLDNAAAVREALAEHRRRLEQVESALEAGDAGFLARWIGEAAGNRRRMLEQVYEKPGELQRLRVHVPDRPGVLAGITQALGAERINLEDFEMQHFSPERGGVFTFLVAGERDAQRAQALLERQGYGVVVSPVLDEA